MTQTQLGKKCVNGSNLYTVSPACIPEFGGANMVFTIGDQKRQRREVLNDRITRPRSGESL